MLPFKAILPFIIASELAGGGIVLGGSLTTVAMDVVVFISVLVKIVEEIVVWVVVRVDVMVVVTRSSSVENRPTE